VLNKNLLVNEAGLYEFQKSMSYYQATGLFYCPSMIDASVMMENGRFGSK